MRTCLDRWGSDVASGCGAGGGGGGECLSSAHQTGSTSTHGWGPGAHLRALAGVQGMEHPEALRF